MTAADSAALPTLAAAARYLEIGQPERTLELLAGSAGDGLEGEVFWLLRSQALYELDRYAEASEAARAGLARSPDSSGMLYLLSNAEAERGNLAGAEEALLAALRIAPDSAEYLARYGVLVARGGQFDKAERLLQRAAALEPDSADVARARAICAFLRGDDRAMARESKAYLASRPDDQYAHYLVGQALLQRRDLGGADRHLRAAARINPSNHEIVAEARDVVWRTHPLLWPLRPFVRLGTLKVWLGFVASVLALQALGLSAVAGVLAILYVLMCVYSWVVPPLLRRWLRWRNR